MGVEWPESPAEPTSHAAKLVREGNSLKCEHCGAHVMTFLDPPPPPPADGARALPAWAPAWPDGREALAEALAEPLPEREETSGLDGLGVSPDWHPQ